MGKVQRRTKIWPFVVIGVVLSVGFIVWDFATHRRVEEFVARSPDIPGAEVPKGPAAERITFHRVKGALTRTFTADDVKISVTWNTPLRPLEASGTSGMNAAFNGVPSLSVLDGWWVEGCIEGVTGWAIGDGAESANSGDAAALYTKLENVVLPLYHRNRAGWIGVMKGAISTNGSFFNSHRMMRHYATGSYIR